MEKCNVNSISKKEKNKEKGGGMWAWLWVNGTKGTGNEGGKIETKLM